MSLETKFEARHAEKIVETFIKIFAAREGLEVTAINVKATKAPEGYSGPMVIYNENLSLDNKDAK